MGSILYNIACPHCGRVAVEDNYYKIDQRYVYCQCCGYTFTRVEKYNEVDGKYYMEETENLGYGICALSKKEGRGTTTLLNSPITDEEIEQFKKEFADENVDKEKSFLVLYQDREFNIVFGKVHENFHLSFEEFKQKYDYDPFRVH